MFCFIFTAKGDEYNVIVRDNEPIKLLESPRAVSVYILMSNVPLTSLHVMYENVEGAKRGYISLRMYLRTS